jgi:hypothetical protein
LRLADIRRFGFALPLRISAFEKTPIRELLAEFHSNQNFKEQRNLFNSNF